MINMNKDIVYFWQTEYKFGEFLKQIFEEQYKRKYSLEGNGIFNLILINDKIYEIKYTQCKSIPAQSTISTRDDKEYIKNKIVENLKCDKDKIKVYGSKFITFPVDKWTAKIELVKKNAMPK